MNHSLPSLPLMELPPLSPGIQVRVMEEAEVLETVRRGWSGGTVRERHQLSVEGYWLSHLSSRPSYLLFRSHLSSTMVSPPPNTQGWLSLSFSLF